MTRHDQPHGNLPPSAPRSWHRFLLALSLLIGCTPKLRTAELGDFELVNGEVIRECRIGYRTFGRLNASKSNAVLVTTWFQGTSADLARHVGPGRLVDTTRYFVVAMDALGNSVSSSPSNSHLQPGKLFPAFSIRDMVESEYLAVTRVLHLAHLHAVVGTSLGGMQALQWATAHPEFMDKTVSIMGSPRAQEDDRRRWEAAAREVQSRSSWQRAARALARGSPWSALHELAIDPDDYARQAGAITTLDVSAPFGGSMPRAAAAIRSEVLVIGTPRDEVVSFRPALDLARLAHASVLELDGRCGHMATRCEKATLWSAVRQFLAN
jgi:homoserine O-acetyltransferase/O-succinyltransferase